LNASDFEGNLGDGIEMEMGVMEAGARRIRRVLFVAQGIYSAGFLAAVTVASLVGAELSDSPTWAGLPAAVLLLGAASGAPLWGWVLDRLGRRHGLSLGVTIGVVGAATAATSIAVGSLWLYLLGMLMLGGARSAVDLGRYVAGEVHPPEFRARAISTVVLGSTVGAVAGPLLVGPAGVWARQFQLPELAGPYLLAAPVLLLVVGWLMLGLRPEPKDLALEVARMHPEKGPGGTTRRSLGEIFGSPGVRAAAIVLISAQVIMVGLMVITSLHMRSHEHPLSMISLVISSHTFGMYAFSFVSGWLTDRWGRRPTILFGIAMLALAGLMSGISPQVLPLSVSLFLLGLGWNFCYVGGSTLLSDHLSAPERARTQGVTDSMVGAASAIGSLGSGFLFAAVGYATMGLIGAVIVIVPIIFLQNWWRLQSRQLPAN
jgi:MFS family permease